jgi:hypothetical protein
LEKKIRCFSVLLCFCGICTAKQVISSGGYAVKPEISVNWILGGSLSDIPAIDMNTFNNLQKEQMTESAIPVKVYPSPATDFINIEIPLVDSGRVHLELYNNSGVKVLNKVVSYQPVFQVNISSIPSGIYYLKLFQPFQDNQLFKVEKVIIR